MLCITKNNIFVENKRMCCTEFNSIYLYYTSQATLANRLAAIQNIIDQNIALMLLVTTGGGGQYAMYELDDGQVRIKTGYRSIEDVVKGNEALEKVKETLLNQLNGRAVKARSQSTYRGWGGCC